MTGALKVGMNDFRMVSKTIFTTNIEHFVCQETKINDFFVTVICCVPCAGFLEYLKQCSYCFYLLRISKSLCYDYYICRLSIIAQGS
jgi:hypothetical protein